jgi:hypothetical protein
MIKEMGLINDGPGRLAFQTDLNRQRINNPASLVNTIRIEMHLRTGLRVAGHRHMARTDNYNIYKNIDKNISHGI